MNPGPSVSLRQRLFGTVMGVSLVWSLLLALAVTVTVRQAVDDLLDNTLQESAEILYGLIRVQGRSPAVTDGGSLPAPLHDEHLVWQVVAPDGRVSWRSHRAPAQALQHPATLGLSTVSDSWRVYGMSMDGGDMLYVAQVAHVRQESKWRAAGAAAAVTLLIGAFCAWWLRAWVSKEIRPIAALSQAVTRYDPMAAEPTRLPATLTELEPMRLAIHDLGERLAQRVSSERAFAAHAAHALRTPLAGMMAQLAVAQVKSAPEALPHLQRMGMGLDRLRSVVAALLTLFRAEQAAVRPGRIPLSELARHLPIETLDIQVRQDGVIWGDADLLSAALINLLDNAQKQGARHVTLDWQSQNAATAGTPAQWAVDIADDGQGLSPAALAQLQASLNGQRYEQLGGLGLMLADLIARAHGGRLLLLSGHAGLHLRLSGNDHPAPSASGVTRFTI
jgi:signal transduction histidine kinase